MAGFFNMKFDSVYLGTQWAALRDFSPIFMKDYFLLHIAYAIWLTEKPLRL